MRVLIIEDEARIVVFVRNALESEGIEVVSAFDGATGLRAAIDGSFDLIVLDLMLPGLPGMTLLAEVKQAKPELPVLILSARSELRDEAARLRARGDRLPDQAVLARGVRRPRARAAAARSSDFESVVMRAGGMELDLVRTAGRHRRRRHRSVRPRVLAAALPGRRGRRGRGARAACSPTSGASTSTRGPTSSTSACAACARSSGRRRGSRPSATAVIAFRWTSNIRPFTRGRT